MYKYFSETIRLAYAAMSPARSQGIFHAHNQTPASIARLTPKAWAAGISVQSPGTRRRCAGWSAVLATFRSWERGRRGGEEEEQGGAAAAGRQGATKGFRAVSVWAGVGESRMELSWQEHDVRCGGQRRGSTVRLGYCSFNSVSRSL